VPAIDQHVDAPAVSGERRLNDLPNLVLERDVRGQTQAIRPQFGANGVQPALVQVGDEHPGALLKQACRDPFADRPGSTGDQRAVLLANASGRGNSVRGIAKFTGG
jgi:hypothetical protein